MKRKNGNGAQEQQDAPLRRSQRISKPTTKKDEIVSKPAPKTTKTMEKVVDEKKEPSEETEKDEPPVSSAPVDAAATGNDDDEENGSVAKKIQDVELEDEEGQTIKVLENLGKKGAVFFVYPKANTPGCTTQACSFSESYDEFEKLGFRVFALSRDSPKAQKSWKEKKNLAFTLLCDPDQKLIKQLGAFKTATSVHRSHFVIDTNGSIIESKIGVKPVDSKNLALEFVKKQ